MVGFQAASGLLPETLRRAAEALTEGEKRRCEEIRLRAGRPASARISGAERTISREQVTGEDLRAVLEAATRSSLHAAMEELAGGFITSQDGVRIGVCGTAVMGAAGAVGIRTFSSLTLRIPREVRGCADGIWEGVTADGFRSLLILSPPGAGKTTLLRELTRRVSDAGTRVCVADERGEIAGCGLRGTPRFDVGAHTDVMTGMPKAEAALALLRAMGPEVLAMDEITDERDAAALLNAVGCGARLLATAHGTGLEDLHARPACRALLNAGAFERCVVVSCRGGSRFYQLRTLA